MTRAGQTAIRARIVIERPVVGMWHSLQAKDGGPLDPKRSVAGEPLSFDFPLRFAAGAKFFGDQVRSEGPVRRFVYIRIGKLAGDAASPCERRMKIDLHDLDPSLLDRAAAAGAVIEITVDGTGRDGLPACATVRPTRRRVV